MKSKAMVYRSRHCFLYIHLEVNTRVCISAVCVQFAPKDSRPRLFSIHLSENTVKTNFDGLLAICHPLLEENIQSMLVTDKVNCFFCSGKSSNCPNWSVSMPCWCAYVDRTSRMLSKTTKCIDLNYGERWNGGRK